jgi:hypothetical protein
MTARIDAPLPASIAVTAPQQPNYSAWDRQDISVLLDRRHGPRVDHIGDFLRRVTNVGKQARNKPEGVLAWNSDRNRVQDMAPVVNLWTLRVGVPCAAGPLPNTSAGFQRGGEGQHILAELLLMEERFLRIFTDC